MKRYRITIFARLFLIVAAITAVLGHEYFRGVISGIDSEKMLAESMIERAGKPFSFVLGADDLQGVTGFLFANGGADPVKDSFTEKSGTGMKIVKYQNATDLENDFVSGKITMMATTPARFALVYDRIKGVSPVAFILSGSNGSNPGIVSKSPIRSTEELKGKTIYTQYGSVGHLFCHYLLSLQKAEKSVKWIFTNSDSDAAHFYDKKSSAVLAYDFNSTVKIDRKNSLSVLSLNPDFCKTVIVVREPDLVLYKEKFFSLSRAFFAAKKSLSSMKISDALSAVEKSGVKMSQTVHPSQYIASESDNLLFFRMTDSRAWDFFNQFDMGLAVSGYSTEYEKPLSASAASTLIISSLNISFSQTQRQMMAATPTTGQFVVFKEKIIFADGKSDIHISSKSVIKKSAVLLSYFPRAVIQISSGTTNDPTMKNVIYEREQSIRRTLSLFNVNQARVISQNNGDPSVAVIIQ